MQLGWLVVASANWAWAGAPLPVSKGGPNCGSGGDLCETQKPAGVLALAEAVALAVEHSPELESLSWEMRAREAASLYGSVRPNPEFAVEVENLGGSGRGWSSSDTTFALEQTLELGGKRSKRAAVLELDRTLAEWDYQAKRLEVQAAVIASFAQVLAAQERVALARDFAEIATSEGQAVQKRVSAGAASALERKQAEVAVATSRLEQELATRRLGIARNGLAASWGETVATFSEARGAFFDVEELSPLEDLEDLTEGVPEVARWNSELQQREATAALEEAQRYPDLQMRGGLRHLGEERANTMVFEMRMPFPLFNRNQGPIGRARFLVGKAQRERRAARLRARAELQMAYQTLVASREEVLSLRSAVLPLAEDAFESARSAYRLGRSSYVEVIGTQRSLYELRARHIEALANYHAAQAELGRTLGRPLLVPPRKGE